MDGFCVYNQIKIHPNDEKHTPIWTPHEIHRYMMMPVNLKNTKATYQHAMSITFCEHLHKIVECYIDDIVVKSQQRIPSPLLENDV